MNQVSNGVWRQFYIYFLKKCHLNYAFVSFAERNGLAVPGFLKSY